ncbi:hypothetical protein VTI74DRAFT_8481 [Chaetomium olivicolor]
MSLPSSPAGGPGHQPLQPVSHNAQRDSTLFSPPRERSNFAETAVPRDSSVHEKITQFNTLAMQSKALERKTADAALKRAMLGREEAEAEMRRYRDEARALRKEVEDLKGRERKVSDRLEAVMDNYRQAKTTHANTQQIWEKEIRRARKETFKAQSNFVKAQEELKSSREAQKALEAELQTEREKSKAHEQEAFGAKYSLAGLQDQLKQAHERITMLEQELSANRALAQSEAAVRRLTQTDFGDDSGSRKRQRTDDSDTETLATLLQWEKQRADRALEQVEFLETECHLKICSAAKAIRRASADRTRHSILKLADPIDPMILSESRRASVEPSRPTPGRSKTDMLRAEKEPRRSTIFLPAEGIFRTVSQAEADALAAKSRTSASSVASPTEPNVPVTPTDSDPMYRRTPSVDPPDFAMLSKERTSLLSLLDAPHRQDPTPIFNIPTTPGPEPATQAKPKEPEEMDIDDAPATVKPQHHHHPQNLTIPPPRPSSPLNSAAPLTDPLPTADLPLSSYTNRPHTTTSHYPSSTTTTTTTITTKVPLREETTDGPTLAQRLMKMQRTPSRQTGRSDEVDVDAPSFDVNNPALTPTMTREEALAQIRERRGRARSVGRIGSGGSAAGSGSGAAANGSSGSGSGSRGGTAGRVSGGSNASGRASAQELRRKVSGGVGGSMSGRASAQEVRRKVSNNDLRGRERDHREVSAPAAASAGQSAVRGVSAVRRVRS